LVGSDGEYALFWEDQVQIVAFHVVTMMPNRENDVNCNLKKRHIGNDYVHIVFNDSDSPYDLNTIKVMFRVERTDLLTDSF